MHLKIVLHLFQSFTSSLKVDFCYNPIKSSDKSEWDEAHREGDAF